MRRRAIARGLTCAVVIACSLVSRRAGAEPSAADRTAARTLFQDGRELLKSGHATDACPKLEESQRLDPGIGTLFNLAECYAQVGRTASAWSAYLDVAEAAKRASQHDREALARTKAEAIEPKLARIAITSAALAPDERISFDGREISVGSLGVAFPIDPGSHDIAASAPGRDAWRDRVSVAPEERVSLVVPALEIPASEPERPKASLVASPAPLASASVHSSGWQSTAAIILGGAAIAGVGAGTFFGLHAKSEWSAAEPACPSSGCSGAGYDAWSSARSSATASSVSFGVAGVLAAAAIVLYVTRPAEP